jgi:hypothetical protein
VRKLAEGFEGGQKPNVMLIGHYHRRFDVEARGIHCLLSGCFESGGSFGVRLGLSDPAVGFHICDLVVADGSVVRWRFWAGRQVDGRGTCCAVDAVVVPAVLRPHGRQRRRADARVSFTSWLNRCPTPACTWVWVSCTNKTSHDTLCPACRKELMDPILLVLLVVGRGDDGQAERVDSSAGLRLLPGEAGARPGLSVEGRVMDVPFRENRACTRTTSSEISGPWGWGRRRRWR